MNPNIFFCFIQNRWSFRPSFCPVVRSFGPFFLSYLKNEKESVLDLCPLYHSMHTLSCSLSYILKYLSMNLSYIEIYLSPNLSYIEIYLSLNFSYIDLYISLNLSYIEIYLSLNLSYIKIYLFLNLSYIVMSLSSSSFVSYFPISLQNYFQTLQVKRFDKKWLAREFTFLFGTF